MSECPLCLNIFTPVSRIPKVLPCGHTYCTFCLNQAFEFNDVFTCNECLEQIDSLIIHNLPTNYNLLKCLQEKRNLVGMCIKSATSSLKKPTFYEVSSQGQDNVGPEFSLSQGSVSQAQECTSQNMDSFNFAKFENNIQEEALWKHMVFNNNFQAPKSKLLQGRSCSKDPNLCIVDDCYNPRMYFKGAKGPFCSPKCAEIYQQNVKSAMTRSVSNGRQRGVSPYDQTGSRVPTPAHSNCLSESGNMVSQGGRDMTRQNRFLVHFAQQKNETVFKRREEGSVRPQMAFGQVSQISTNKKNMVQPQRNLVMKNQISGGMKNVNTFFGVNIQHENARQNNEVGLMSNAVVSDTTVNRVPFPSSMAEAGFNRIAYRD